MKPKSNKLHEAAIVGDIKVLDSIKSAKQLIEKDAHGNTPIDIALHVLLKENNIVNRLKVLEWLRVLMRKNLLTADALLMVNRQTGNTPLHYLIQLKEKDMVEYCINKCDKAYGNRNYLYIKNRDGITPWNKQSFQAIKTLLKFDKPEFNYQDGISPLHLISQSASLLAKEGLIKPFMLIRKNKDGKTPLHLVANSPLLNTDQRNLISLLKSGYDEVIDIAKQDKSDTWLHDIISNHSSARYILQDLVNQKIFPLKCLQSLDEHNNTPLHIAAERGDEDIVELLVKLGANLDAVNDEKLTPKNYAASYLNQDVFLYLFDVSQKDKINKKDADIAWMQFNAAHQIYFVYGGEKLNSKFELPEFYDGGFVSNILPILKNSLTNFAAKRPKEEQRHFEGMQNLLATFKNINRVNEEDIKNIISGKPLLTTAGYKTHVIGVTFEKKGEEIIMSMAERGALATLADKPHTAHAISTLRFPTDAKKIKDIIELLAKAKQSEKKIAKDIIFSDIPKAANAEFKKENSSRIDLISKLFKTGICFWANFKTVIHDCFIKEFGISKGQLLYKAYDIFLHQETLKLYLATTPEEEQDKKFIATCQEIIDNKFISYLNRSQQMQMQKNDVANDALKPEENVKPAIRIN